MLELAADDGRRLRLEWDFDRCRYALRDAATGADLTAGHGSGTDPRGLARTLYGVDRDVYLRLGCVDQAELDRIGDAGSVRHAVETVLTQARADASAVTAVETLKAHRSRLVGVNRARTNPLPEAEAEAATLRTRLDAAAAERAEVEQAAAGRDTARAHADAAAVELHTLESVRDHLRADELRRRLDIAEGLADAAAGADLKLEAAVDGAGFTPIDAMPALRGRMLDLEADARAAHRRHGRRRRAGGRHRRAPPRARGTRDGIRGRSRRRRARARGRGRRRGGGRGAPSRRAPGGRSCREPRWRSPVSSPACPC